ncbi:hypothetical protein MMC20_005234 [Loxospora ochrophaea]|nr:hypothetical protein [Loxospora ochrophaea]
MENTDVLQKPFRFLDLPSEIQLNIFDFLLVKRGFHRRGKGSSGVGTLNIETVSPKKYNPSSLRCPYQIAPTGIDGKSQLTTYYVSCIFDVQVFLICRKIYYEASTIFYSRNRFYAHSINALMPFLKDRSSRARKNIAFISIPFISPRTIRECRQGLEQLKIEPELSFLMGFEKTWDDTCAYLSSPGGMLPNLKQLDLRMWDEVEDTTQDHEAGHFTDSRIKQLASIADPAVLTISNWDWFHYPTNYGSGLALKPLVEELCLRIQVQRQQIISKMAAEEPANESSAD